MKRLSSFVIAIVVAGGLLFSAAGPAMADEPDPITIATRSEPSIDPHFLYTEPNIGYAKHIYGRLVGRDNQSHREPDLAVSWKAIDDTTWEFNLRKGVKFHDGSEFTAEDVVFSIKRIPNVPNNPGTYAGNLRSITDVKAAGPYKIIIKTDKPNPVLPTQLHNVSIVSKQQVTGASTADFSSGKVAVGTGPYKFVEYVPGDRLVLERFDGYWGTLPAFKRVVFKIVSNDAARVAALLAGDADLIDFVPPTEVAHLTQNKNIKLFKRPADRIIFFHMDSIRDNTPYVKKLDGSPLIPNPLKDPRVRKALSLAINRQAICSRVMEGLAEPESQLVPSGWFGHSPNLKVDPYDPARAKQLLAEAGYPDGFAMTVHGPNDRYVNDYKICQAVAQMFARIGIKVQVETMPKSVYFGKYVPPDPQFSFAMMGWGTSATCESIHGLMGLLHSYDKAKGLGAYNLGYASPDFDSVAEKAVVIVNDQEREEMLHKAMEIAMNDMAAIPMHTQFTVSAGRQGIDYTVRPDEMTLAYNARPAR